MPTVLSQFCCSTGETKPRTRRVFGRVLVVVFTLSMVAHGQGLEGSGRIEGLLFGASVGIADGGPPEFQKSERSYWLTRGESLDDEVVRGLAWLCPMAAYYPPAEP